MSGFLKLTVAVSVLAAAFAERLQFDGVRFATADSDKHNGYASSSAEINGTAYPVMFENIIRTGDVVDGVTFGLLVDHKGVTIKNIEKGSTFSTDGIATTLTTSQQSQSLDYSSFIQVGETNKYRVMSHFESSVGMMNMFEMTFDSATCSLGNVEKLSVVDWSGSGGLWNPCAGALSPWGTHLGSEEYEPDARPLSKQATYFDGTSYIIPTLATLNKVGDLWSSLEWIRYFGIYPEDVTTISDILAVYKPYMYGYAIEVTSDDGMSTDAVKRWAIGRKAFEMLLVLPDQVTAYGTDDGASGLITRFVANTAGDLSSGILYASKVTQVATPPTDAFEAGEFTVEWINLGQATDAEIRTAAETMDFADIFEFEEPNATAPWCNTGYTSVHTYNHECLKLKTGMEIIASRLEMRRYAAMLGATVEFNKMEGISLDIKNNKMYLGMSAVDKGMLDSPTNYDKGGNAQIAVPKNSCGCVYELAMDASYAVITIKPTVCGKAGTVGDSNNACDVNNIANPDNIWYDNKYELLFIAEDTSKHQNDVMWQYEQTTGVLTRILSSPYGSEITSTEFHHWGECDIMEIVFQHPYGETDRAMLLEKGNSGEEAYLSYMRMPKITASATSASSSATRLGTSLFLGMISLSVILCVL